MHKQQEAYIWRQEQSGKPEQDLEVVGNSSPCLEVKGFCYCSIPEGLAYALYLGTDGAKQSLVRIKRDDTFNACVIPST